MVKTIVVVDTQPLEQFEHLEGASVATERGLVTLSWFARVELLERVRRLHGGAEVVRQFNESAYAADPVRLAPDSEALVLDLLQHWLGEDRVGEPPPGIVELRNALIDTV